MRPLYLKARYRLPWGGREVFLKVFHAASGGKRAFVRRQASRERASLSILRGLAVPALVRLTPDSLRRLLGFRPAAYLAQEFVPGASLRKAGLPPTEQIGAWLFLLEQLAAFRRRGVLQTDLKPSNVMVTRKPLSARHVDFNLATAVRSSREYPESWFGYTVGYQAPEQGIAARVTERALTYQLGMLLAAGWLGADNSTLMGENAALARLRRELRRLGSPGLARLVGDCLSLSPGARPADYGEALERAKALRSRGLPAAALRVWEELRAPYAGALAKSRLRW